MTCFSVRLLKSSFSFPTSNCQLSIYLTHLIFLIPLLFPIETGLMYLICYFTYFMCTKQNYKFIITILVSVNLPNTMFPGISYCKLCLHCKQTVLVWNCFDTILFIMLSLWKSDCNLERDVMLIRYIARDDLMRLWNERYDDVSMYATAALMIHVLFYDNHYYLCHVYLYFSKWNEWLFSVWWLLWHSRLDWVVIAFQVEKG